MGKWIGKNLAPLLVFSAAVLYFFGTLAAAARSQFLHTSFLVYAPSYADVALVGFHPLFAYFVSFLPLLTPLGYALLMYWSRLDPDTLRLRSQGSPANTRSEAVMQKVKHSSRMVQFWKLVMGNKVHVFIILGFLLSGVLQSDIISVLQINSDSNAPAFCRSTCSRILPFRG